METDYERLRKEGYLLAGGLRDLSQRASVYYHLYEDSGGRNVFPLIAAHGALWASGYFAKGMLIGRLCSLQHLFNTRRKHELYTSLVDFANAFRDINRRVCAEAYAIYHYTALHGETECSKKLAAPEFLSVLLECHESTRRQAEFPQHSRRELFRGFFLWEQHGIVAPAVEAAVAKFAWTPMKKLALKPNVAFSYFGRGKGLRFANFANTEERIVKGLLAYERAEARTLPMVEAALRHYDVLPPAFFHSSLEHYRQLRTTLALLPFAQPGLNP
jgi:hypothetical protein